MSIFVPAHTDPPTQDEEDEINVLGQDHPFDMPEHVHNLTKQVLGAPKHIQHAVYRHLNTLSGGSLRTMARSIIHDRRTAVRSLFGPQANGVKIPPIFEATVNMYHRTTIGVIRAFRMPMVDLDLPGVKLIMALESGHGRITESDLHQVFLVMYTNRGPLLFQRLETVELTPLDETGIRLTLAEEVDIPLLKNVNVGSFIGNALYDMGSSFFSYHTYNGTGSEFVYNVLLANATRGVIEFDQPVKNFVRINKAGDTQAAGLKGVSAHTSSKRKGVVAHGGGFAREAFENAHDYVKGHADLAPHGAEFVKHIMGSQVPWTHTMKHQVTGILSADSPEDTLHRINMVNVDGIKNSNGDKYSVPEYLAGMMVDSSGDHTHPFHVDYKQVFPQAKGITKNREHALDPESLTEHEKVALTVPGRYPVENSFWDVV